MPHSEGPWTFVEGDRRAHAASMIHKTNDRGFPIANVVCEASNALQREEDIANARLIAASPDLLDALKMLLNVIPPTTAFTEASIAATAARCAIAKAEGKSLAHV